MCVIVCQAVLVKLDGSLAIFCFSDCYVVQ